VCEQPISQNAHPERLSPKETLGWFALRPRRLCGVFFDCFGENLRCKDLPEGYRMRSPLLSLTFVAERKKKCGIFRRPMILRMLAGLALLLIAAAVPAQSPLLGGLRHELRTTDAPHSIHILEVDPSRWRIRAVRALDQGVGRETVSSLAERHGARAAINAGFFRIGGRYDGEPTGVLRIAGEWFSDSSLARAAVGWRLDGREYVIGRLTVNWYLQSEGRRYQVNGINRPRGAHEAILFNWAFHRSTLTDPGGVEVRIAGDKVVAISRDGNSPIPPQGIVYSVGPRSRVNVNRLEVGDLVRADYRLSISAGSSTIDPGRWRAMDFVVGGAGLLLRDRRVLQKYRDEKLRAGFSTELHPRTALGFKEDGTWVFVVVDGRQPGISIGMSLPELADLMLALGCTDALNLDGGGSSTLYLDQGIKNSPSDGRERPVSDAILVLPR
jgi:hypothetical protein